MLNHFINFLKSVLSDKPDSLSFARLGTAIIVMFVLIDMSYVVIHTGTFPDTSIILSLCAFNTSLYLTGKKYTTDVAIADINKFKPCLPETNNTTANVIVQP